MDTAPIILRTVALLAALLLWTAAPVGAADLRIDLVNDPATANPRPDDLYTSDLRIDLSFERFRVVAGERMFTDRERNLRFDETHISVVTELRPLGGWKTEGGVGVLRAGQGFLGQPVQNKVHRWIGSDEVRLPYAASQNFATAAVTMKRTFRDRGATRVAAEIDASAAPGFRNWARATALLDRPVLSGTSLQIGIGVRADAVDRALFGDRIGGVSPTAHAALAYRSMEVRWSWNDYGTRSPHISLGVRTPMTTGKRAY